mgnify:CR=1 FL=1
MRFPTTVVSFMLLLLAGGLSVGCGKKSAPVAPELSAPGPIKTIQAKVQEGTILLEWNRPTVNASGESLGDLKEFHVFRTPVVKGEEPKYTKVASVDVPADSQVTQFRYADKDLGGGKAYEYQVIAVSMDGITSADAKTVRVNYKGSNSTVEIY